MDLITLKSEGLRPLTGDLTNQVLVINHTRLISRYQLPRFQLFKATGGFGCQEHSLGRAVFGYCVASNEDARWNRSDFIGIASDQLIHRAMEDATPVDELDINARIYLVFSKDGTFEKGDTVHSAMTRLRRITESPVLVAYHAHPESQITDDGFLIYPQGTTLTEVKVKKKGELWIDAS